MTIEVAVPAVSIEEGTQHWIGERDTDVEVSVVKNHSTGYEGDSLHCTRILYWRLQKEIFTLYRHYIKGLPGVMPHAALKVLSSRIKETQASPVRRRYSLYSNFEI